MKTGSMKSATTTTKTKGVWSWWKLNWKPCAQ